MNEQIYCSIDLELSGFDPAKDEILEVGFVLFKAGKERFEVIEEWTKVFKPHQEVRHKILGLTGISQAELDSAPEFEEYRDFLKSKLQDVVIVGHGVTLDIRFLEAFGVPCPQKPIDTLELVQWLLPTHHSYNLENLMHYFAISHKEAHRALADSKATIQLLTRLLQIHSSLPAEEQILVKKIVKGQGFAWEPLLNMKLEQAVTRNEQVPNPIMESKLEIEPQTVVIASLEQNIAEVAIGGAPKNTKSVVVLQDKAAVMDYWKRGAATGAFIGADVFDNSKFEYLTDQNIESPELALFLLKILVWRATNWQVKSIRDLNLSFFGSQFKSLVTGGESFIDEAQNILAVDQRTYIALLEQGHLAGRFAIITSLLKLEDQIASASGVRVSWYGVLSALKSIYNPETEMGSLEHRELVLELLSAADLYFGLVSMLMRQANPSVGTVALRELREKDPYRITRLQAATASFCEKLNQLSPDFPQLATFVQRLTIFFAETENMVEWIEFGEHHVILASQPLNLEAVVQELLPLDNIAFVDNIQHEGLLKYVMARLGLEKYRVINDDQQSGQKIKTILKKQVPSAEVLQKELSVETLPAVLLLSDTNEVKRFYDQFYTKIKEIASIFAEKYSGGTTKLFRNFSIRKESVLLITPETFIKSAVQLPAKTLVLSDLMFKSSPHPYLLALKQYWSADFPNFDTLKRAEILHEIVQRCQITDLKEVIVYESHTDDASEAVKELLVESKLFSLS